MSYFLLLCEYAVCSENEGIDMAKIRLPMAALRVTLGAAAICSLVGSPQALSMPDAQCATIKTIVSQKSNRWDGLRGQEVPSTNRPGALFQRQRWAMRGDVKPFETCYIQDKTYKSGTPFRSVYCTFKVPTVPDKSVMTDELSERLLTSFNGVAREFAQCLGSKPKESTGMNDSATSQTIDWEWEFSPPEVPQPVKVSLGGWIPKVGVVVDGVYTHASLLATFQ